MILSGLLAIWAAGAGITAFIAIFMICGGDIDLDEAIAIIVFWPLVILKHLITGFFKVFIG